MAYLDSCRCMPVCFLRFRCGVGRRCAHGAAVFAPPCPEAPRAFPSSALRRCGAHRVRMIRASIIVLRVLRSANSVSYARPNWKEHRLHGGVFGVCIHMLRTTPFHSARVGGPASARYKYIHKRFSVWPFAIGSVGCAWRISCVSRVYGTFF